MKPIEQMILKLDKDATTKLGNGKDHNVLPKEMELEFGSFVSLLMMPNNVFNADKALEILDSYLSKYHRILYSSISNVIYQAYESEKNEDITDTLLANIDALVNSVAHYKSTKENKALNHQNNADDIEKVILKLWDHVTLCIHQYEVLVRTHDEYDKKFQDRIKDYKNEMMKEMNTQMITMVGIFTALAFLIFGSMSSLDGVFENLDMPLFKVMSVGLIWGLCVSNMIFVFLYCIGHMTKLKLLATDDPNATILQRYPVVWWTNFMLTGLLMFTSWGYFVQNNSMGKSIIRAINAEPWFIFILGSAVIAIILVAGIAVLSKKTLPSKDTKQ